MIRVDEFIRFAALAQDKFNMEPRTMTIEFHPFPDSRRIVLTRLQEEVYNSFDTQIAYRQDVVELSVFANFEDKRIVMGYSQAFNVLVVCDYPERKENDNKNKEKIVEREDKRSVGVGLNDSDMVYHLAGRIHCDCCGSRLFTLIKD